MQAIERNWGRHESFWGSLERRLALILSAAENLQQRKARPLFGKLYDTELYLRGPLWFVLEIPWN